MMAEAKALPPPVPDTSARLSEYKDTFRAHDDGDVNATSQTGRRRMRNQDGGPAAADLIFLTEGQLISPATASRMAAAGGALGATTSSLGRTAALPNPDVPITIYSEAVAKGTYTNTWTPGSRLLSSGTAAMSTASPGPFARYTNFSKPMSDFTKDPSNE